MVNINGIDECIYDGKIVNIAGLNAYDAPAYIYDSYGNMIGTCSYAWGTVDEICNKFMIFLHRQEIYIPTYFLNYLFKY